MIKLPNETHFLKLCKIQGMYSEYYREFREIVLMCVVYDIKRAIKQ